MLVNFSSADNRTHVDRGILDYLNNFYSNSCQSLLFNAELCPEIAYKVLVLEVNRWPSGSPTQLRI